MDFFVHVPGRDVFQDPNRSHCYISVFSVIPKSSSHRRISLYKAEDAPRETQVLALASCIYLGLFASLPEDSSLSLRSSDVRVYTCYILHCASVIGM